MTIMVFHTALPLIKKWPSQNFPHHPEAAVLIGQWMAFDDPVIVTTRWQYLTELGQLYPETVHVLNQHPIYDAVSPIARIHGSRD